MSKTTRSSQEHLECGKMLYREKKYKEAYDSFKIALQTNTSSKMDVLDCLAAGAEKLDKMQDALSHGRQMLRLEESNARGYLRIGRILEHQNTEDMDKKALSIYNLGLRKVSHMDGNLDLLNEARLKLFRKLCPPTATDLMKSFPPEIVDAILQHLEFYEIVRCLRVSKPWARYIQSNPSYWQHLAFNHGNTHRQNRIGYKFIKNCIAYSRRSIKSADFAACSDGNALRALAYHCKHLESLTIGSASELGSRSLLPALESATALRALRVNNRIGLSNIVHILGAMKCLEELYIDNFWWVNEGQGFGLTSVQAPIKVLSLQSDMTRNLGQLFTIDDNFFGRLPLLERLSFKGVHFDSAALASLTRLQKLSLNNCIAQGLAIAQELPPTLKELALLSPAKSYGNRRELVNKPPDVLKNKCLYDLEVLSLDWAGQDTSFVETITAKYSKIRELHFSTCYLDGVDLKSFVTSLKYLRVLEFKDCPRVPTDAVEYARGKGITVIHIVALDPKNKKLGNARSVRYGY